MNGGLKLWMGVALGSVLVLGLSAGLLADRLLPERRDAGDHHDAPASAHPPRSSMFHFDCRDSEENAAEAAADRTSDAVADATRSEAFEQHRSKMTRRMAHRLELDPEQMEALEPIVGEAMVRGGRYWAGARDEFCAMQREFHRQVEEILRPEQSVRFDEMQRDLWKRSRRHGDHDDDRDRRDDDDLPGECR